MNAIYSIGLDLAKNTFQLHGADKRGKTVFKKRLSRAKVLSFFANLASGVVGIEACAGSNYWAREIEKLGHEVKIIPAQFVKPYVKSNKTDASDAEAICEALSRPNMRFAPIKSVDQQDIQSIHRIRERLVSARTTLACEIRGLLHEYGIVVPKGIRILIKSMADIIADPSNQLTSLTRELIQELNIELRELTNKVEHYNQRIEMIHSFHPEAQRLTKIPGVGILSATAIIGAIGDPGVFKNGRAFSAWIGLVPKEYSSGNTKRMMGITKRGDKYIRTMLVHGARAYLAHSDRMNRNDKRHLWVKQVKERRGYNKAIVALANKNARTIWAMLARGEDFKQVA